MRSTRKGMEIALLLCVLALSGRDDGQTPQSTTGVPGKPEVPFAGFDVVSVKPDHSDSGNMSINSDELKITADNTTLAMLLTNAYGMREELISGLPSWAKDAHWDIRAKMLDPAEVPKPLGKESDDEKVRQQQQRWQWILKQRFHLKAHEEQRLLPVYDLVIAGDGTKLQKTTAPESKQGNTWVNNQDMTATGVKIASLTWTLAGVVGRNVIDKPGLPGLYDIHLRWSTEQQLAAADSGTTDRPPSIFTALQEQLGLKLVSAKGPVDTLVVDWVEQPSPD